TISISDSHGARDTLGNHNRGRTCNSSRSGSHVDSDSGSTKAGQVNSSRDKVTTNSSSTGSSSSDTYRTTTSGQHAARGTSNTSIGEGHRTSGSARTSTARISNGYCTRDRLPNNNRGRTCDSRRSRPLIDRLGGGCRTGSSTVGRTYSDGEGGG